MDADIVPNQNSQFDIGEAKWASNSYHCHLAILRDDATQYSVIVLNLPGAGSCGETEEEAIENAREAIAGVLETYIEERKDIPWRKTTEYEIPEGAQQKWILVNV